MSSDPPFSWSTTRYDMNSYVGRCRYFFEAIDPRKCLETSESLASQQLLLKQFDDGKLPKGTTNAQLWDARTSVEACVHPVTKEVIFPLFRFAAFIPMNVFIVPFMMLPSTMASPTRTVLIHWFNQSYNTTINYANRASDAQPMLPLVQAYGAAVSVSLAGALSATFMLRNLKPSPLTTLIRATVPMCAVAFASTANLAMMRRNEWYPGGDGITVRDEDGKDCGKSVRAGQEALKRCAVARFLWNIPCMTLPPLLSAPLYNFTVFRSNPIAVETTLVVAGMLSGVAPALAFYPTTVSVNAGVLEPQFQNLVRANGKKVETLTFYKGL